MKTHEAKNWGELAMILTARLRLQYICTGAADKRRAAFLMEIMQRSGEADPAAALSYMVMAETAPQATTFFGIGRPCTSGGA